MDIAQGNKINRRALFCSETSDYRVPEEPETGDQVKLRFRTGRSDADHVCFVEGDRETRMRLSASDELFDYYEHTITAGGEQIRYSFKVIKGNDICYYNRLGVCDQDQAGHSFKITPGFHTPTWAKGAVIYQIFVDRFCNGDLSNDVETREYWYIGNAVQRIEDWNQNPSAMDVGHFYGGDLKGVWDKLDYLQSLGVEVLYFNPIFVSPSNHKYDCQDYEHIDPHYGVVVKDGGELIDETATDNSGATKYMIRTTDRKNLEASDAFFADFVREVHRRGMKIILDGVFNHCGSFNKWLDGEGIYKRSGSYEPGAFETKDSPYHTFFKFYDEAGWPDNNSYDGWWGHDTLPKLNYEDSPKLIEHILNVARKWISPPYCIDGWRLDVAADLGYSDEFNHKFWRMFRKAVKEVNPEVLIIAEHYGDPVDWLQGDQWDTIMNYDAFMEPVTWFLTGMEKHSDEYNDRLYGDGKGFFNAMAYHMSLMQTPSVLTSMNELSNHDHSRFLTRTNRLVGRIGTLGAAMASENVRPAVMREAVVIQMTWPGAPTVYYGDEAALCGWTDPDNRRTYPWGREDLEMIEFHRYMIKIHKSLPVLKYGSVKGLYADNQVIAYGRMYRQYQAVVAVNNSESERYMELPVWELGVTDDMPLARVMQTMEGGYNVGALPYQVRDGLLKLTLPGNSAILLVSHGEEFFSVPQLTETCRGN